MTGHPLPTVDSASYQGPWGRMRSRSVGDAPPGVPEVVVVQGLAVADYLLPAVAALGGWTRAHLLELPGFDGGPDRRRRLTVAEFGLAVADWLGACRIARVVLAGHSSGSQVAAEAAAGRPDLAGVVLASPMVDPAVRGLIPLAVAWLRDGGREPPGLIRSQLPEWRRSGARRLAYLVRVHRAHVLDEPVARLRVPVLVVRGRDDTLSTAQWGRRLAAQAADGTYVELPGAHSFPWRAPAAWSDPIRAFTDRLP
jgi:pimeloyl-ACP methyl ester carboxylesterase